MRLAISLQIAPRGAGHFVPATSVAARGLRDHTQQDPRRLGRLPNAHFIFPVVWCAVTIYYSPPAFLQLSNPVEKPDVQ